MSGDDRDAVRAEELARRAPRERQLLAIEENSRTTRPSM